MTTPAEQSVLDALIEYAGDVPRVAEELGVSKSWVYRVQRTNKAVAPQEPKPLQTQEVFAALLPPNVQAVGELRDLTLADLKRMTTEGLLNATEATRLLRVLLQYETALREVATPALNVFNDNRVQSVQLVSLVDKLGEMHPDQLRALTGVSEPIIEGEYTPTEE